MIASKKRLAVVLSRLQSFERPSIKLEQYPTDSEIAAEVIWNAYQLGDIAGKTIADLGCGTGILGIGTMFFSPEFVYLIDKDERALRKVKNNIELMELNVEYDTILSDVNKFDKKVDIVIQNPPFGTKEKHADKVFLEKAFNIAEVIYTFHKTSTKNFVEKISKDNNFDITHSWDFAFPLKQSQSFHKRKLHRIEVTCWRLEKLL